MLALFGSAALASAFLIFWVEPLFAKLVLPMLGGSPAVWNTCLMVFQSLLLVGYLYAHASTKYLTARAQVVTHMSLLAACFILMPLGLHPGWTPPGSGNVILWLVVVLTTSMGPPFIVLSATAPLLQRWLATTDTPVKDPYVLYAASNAGSFFGLLAFPLLLEPAFRLHQQAILWSFVYFVAVSLIVICGGVIWTRLPRYAESVTDLRARNVPPPPWQNRLLWVALAFVPSSLLLGVTTYLSTDVAATPLLWVVPLSLYLLTFVVVFSGKAGKVTVPASVIHALLIVTFAMVLFWQASIGFQRGYALHLGVFTFTALVLHGRLAASRPSTDHLTEYYLWIAFGGALGGAFTALVVPLLFESTRDYLIMVVLACFLRPSLRMANRAFQLQPRNIPLVLVPAALLAIVSKYDIDGSKLVGVPIFWIASIVAAGIAMSFHRNALRFSVAVAAIATAGLFFQESHGTIFSDRSFFGIYRVAIAKGPVTVLYHGTTIHGAQFTDSARRLTPITYYHPDGPVGQVFQSLQATPANRAIGVVGLGTGSILCYSRPGESWTFFEIDPAVEEIARNPRYFSFLSDCAVKPRVVIGDARLTLAREPDSLYSLLVLDAFSSDAIPVHLLTREALAVYRRVLTPDGLLLVHISNRRLNLEPVVAALARNAGLVALIQNHDAPPSRQDNEYDYGSDWVLMAAELADFGKLAADTLWEDLRTTERTRPWTDDYSNLLSVIRW